MLSTTKTRLYLGAAALAVTLGLLLFATGAAYGSPGGHDRPVGEIKVIEPCTAAQANANGGRGAVGVHNGDRYRCRETKPGCYTWVWQYDGRPKTGKSYSKPTCPACTPSPSKPASANPSAGASPASSASASPSKTPAPPATLPVTDLPTVVIGIAATGTLLIASGAVLLIASFRRRTR